MSFLHAASNRSSTAKPPAARAWPPRAEPPRGALDHPDIVLDVSRLLSRVLHPTPTGVDRVEMAYALGLLRLTPARLSFAACHPSGIHGHLHKAAAVDFLNLTAERWDQEGQAESHGRRWRRAAAACWRLTPRGAPRPPDRPRAYLHLSTRGLERRNMLIQALRRERARFIPFIHDLIPLEHPEYARPAGAELFARKLETATSLATGLLCNSQATARALESHLAARGRSLPICPAGLGVSLDAAPAQFRTQAPARPYFLLLGTIDPRKNHLLILHIWRRLIADQGPARTPELVLVGRRGWENEMVLDLLDRTPGFKGVVRELNRIPDIELRRLIRGARAVLMPSFAEGFGLPVAEALSLGAPVIASDLAALREAGGAVPDYLDPLDGGAWTSAILDYAKPDSRQRRAQLGRLTGWRAPSWDEHLDHALGFIAEICK